MRLHAIGFRAGLLGAAFLTATGHADAQYDGSRWSMSSTSTVRRAVAAPGVTASRTVYRQPYYYYNGVGGGYYGGGYGGYYYRQPYIVTSEYVSSYTIRYIDESTTNNQVFLFPSPQYRNFTPQPVAYTLIQAYALADGTVLADFGLGLEPVRRFCGDQFVLDGGSPPPPATVRVQPAPSQPTQSAQNATAQRFPTLTPAAQGACYTSDRYGRFFAVR